MHICLDPPNGIFNISVYLINLPSTKLGKSTDLVAAYAAASRYRLINVSQIQMPQQYTRTISDWCQSVETVGDTLVVGIVPTIHADHLQNQNREI